MSVAKLPYQYETIIKSLRQELAVVGSERDALKEIIKHDGYDADGHYILCVDCRDSGWNEDREGRSPCTCVSESEPYQLLEAEGERLSLSRIKAAQVSIENESLRAEVGWLTDRNVYLSPLVGKLTKKLEQAEAETNDLMTIATLENEMLRAEVATLNKEIAFRSETEVELRAELTAISEALKTNDGHSSVDNVRALKSGRDLLVREIRKQDHSYLNTVVDNIMED